MKIFKNRKNRVFLAVLFLITKKKRKKVIQMSNRKNCPPKNIQYGSENEGRDGSSRHTSCKRSNHGRIHVV